MADTVFKQELKAKEEKTSITIKIERQDPIEQLNPVSTYANPWKLSEKPNVCADVCVCVVFF